MRTVAAIFAIILALSIAAWGLTPSAPRLADVSAAAFSAGRAMETVRGVGARPHPMGSAADRAVVLGLVHRFAALGLPVALLPVVPDERARAKYARWSGRPAPADLMGQSILAVLPGRDRAAPAVLMMAHHDSVWGSPGAADDGIGVATLIETARALRFGPQPARDMLFLITDGEELGLNGSEAFFSSAGLRNHVGVVLNFEARGAAGRAVMFETGPGNGAMMGAFARAVPWPSATSLAVFVYRRMPNSTDLTNALKAGLPGFNFAIAGRAGLYHSPLATPDRLDPRSLQDMGQQGLGLARTLAFAPVLPGRSGEAIFSDLWSTRLIVYPAWGGWAILIAAVLCTGLAAWRVRVPMREVAVGFIMPAMWLVGGGLLLFAANLLSGAGSSANYYDRLAAIPRLEVQAILICVALLAPGLSWRTSLWGGWIAQFGLIALVGFVLQIVAPPATPILHWPLLLAALAMTAAAWLDPTLRRPNALAPVALLAAAGSAQLLMIAHQLFTLVGPGVPEVMLVPLLGIAMLVWPLLHRLLPARVAWSLSALLILAAVAISLWVRLDPIAPSVPVYAADKR